MCSSCETPFCKLCIERWKLLKNSCPSRCDSPLTLKPISRALKNLLDRVEIKCDKGCIVSLLNYKTHLLSCLWSKQETPKGNNKQIHICLYFLKE